MSHDIIVQRAKKKKNQLINVFIVVSLLVSVSPMISWASVYDLVCLSIN